MKTRLFTTIILFFLLQSCNAVQINESGYRSLNYMKNLHVKPFKTVNNYTTYNQGDNKYIFKIDSKEILETAKNNQYTWLHTWLPYCPSDNCQNITPYKSLASDYKDKGLKTLFTSATYDFKYIFNITENSNFNLPIHVLDGEYYGYKNKKIRLKLYKDLNIEAKEDDYIFHEDYVFKGDSLVFMGEITDSILDKLIK